MGDLCFGKAFEMLEHEKNRHVIDLLANATHMHLILGTKPSMKTLGLNKILFGKIYRRRMQYMAYSKVQAAERTQLGLDTDRKDFFYHLLNARDPQTGKGFTASELWGESNLLIIAGSDTTSSALASAFFYLVHNPATLEQLTAEVTSESVALAQSAFCPFSVGPRGCIGKGLAYAELMTTLARVVFMYDMKLAEGTSAGEGRPEWEWGRQRREEYQLRDTFTSLKDGPYVKFRARA
ncbi:Cytochrome P450 [Diplocarpon rosae]|nr:Cytochrome P450 [Diplocarpon rosae]